MTNEDIDLRTYITVFLKYKYWIAGLTVVAALVAFGLSAIAPPTYEATALVAITKPRYAFQFDTRLEAVSNVQPTYRAYPALATGDQIVQALYEELGSAGQSMSRFRKKLSTDTGGDPSIIKVQARDRSPERAAAIANRWAELFVKSANALHGQSQEELAFFEAQFAEAEKTLAQVDQEIIAFQVRNEAAILEAELGDKQAALRERLEIIRSLRLIIQDARALQGQLHTRDVSAVASLSDELSALLLGVDALSSARQQTAPIATEEQGLVFVPGAGSNAPAIQLQITGQGSLSDRTVGDLLADLDALVDALQDKLAALEGEMQTLKPDILELQERLQEALAESGRLELAQRVAEETYLTLSRKVAEMQIAAQEEAGDVRLASRPAAPEEPVAPNKLVNTAIAGALGLCVSAFGVLAIEFWREWSPPKKA